MLAHVSHWRSDITLTIYLRLPLVPARSWQGLTWGPGQLYTRRLNRWPLVCPCQCGAVVTVTGGRRAQVDAGSCTDSALSRSQETPSSSHSQPKTPIVIEGSLMLGRQREREGQDLLPQESDETCQPQPGLGWTHGRIRKVQMD